MYQESVEKLSSQERIIAELEAKLGDLQRENTELSSNTKRRESVSSGEFSPSHAKEASSVLSDTSFEVRPPASTGATSSSSGVSSDDSDTEASNSDCGQVRPVVIVTP